MGEAVAMLIVGAVFGALAAVAVPALLRRRVAAPGPTLDDIFARAQAAGVGLPSQESSDLQMRQLANLEARQVECERRIDVLEVRVGFAPTGKFDKRPQS